MSLLLGICGGSGSGKSTLAEGVVSRLGPARASLLAFDTYYRDHGHLTPEQRAEVNYDHPDSLDIELFTAHLDALLAGQDIEAPVYDFATHTRPGETMYVEARNIVVVEGILLLAFEDIANRLSVRVFRDCPEALRFTRRLERDIAERGRTPESVTRQFKATVKPMHDLFVQPSAASADLVISGEGELSDHIDTVLRALPTTL